MDPGKESEFTKRKKKKKIAPGPLAALNHFLDWTKEGAVPTGVAATRPRLRQPTTALGALPRGQTLLANSAFKEKTLVVFEAGPGE